MKSQMYKGLLIENFTQLKPHGAASAEIWSLHCENANNNCLRLTCQCMSIFQISLNINEMHILLPFHSLPARFNYWGI